MNRILNRLAIVWFGLLGLLYLFIAANGHPDGVVFTIFALPGVLLLMLAWVFAPRLHR